ncbi:MAG: FHA domain-containing protein, partial [Deltaproteobacteria bacterium]|nr:FHA domain-containing protein [Deltaproteobacteria bacterium]
LGGGLAFVLTPLDSLPPEDPWRGILWGGGMALLGMTPRRLFSKRWLRVLMGAHEDYIFPLQGKTITLGKLESNDIPLLGSEEVFPRHCEIRWVADHYEIIDDEQGGVVLVNFRPIQNHPLKPGDLIKVGSALLQYGEGGRQ